MKKNKNKIQKMTEKYLRENEQGVGKGNPIYL